MCDAFGGKHEKIVSVSGVSQTSATLVYNSMCSLRVRLRMVQLLGRGKRADTLSMFSLLPTTVAVCVSTCRRGSYHRGTLGVEHRRRRGEGDETAVQARRQNPARGRQSCGQTDAPVHGHERLVDARVQQQAEVLRQPSETCDMLRRCTQETKLAFSCAPGHARAGALSSTQGAIRSQSLRYASRSSSPRVSTHDHDVDVEHGVGREPQVQGGDSREEADGLRSMTRVFTPTK